MSVAHRLPISPSLTRCDFLVLAPTKVNTMGAICCTDFPWIHLSIQKRVLAPLPTSTMIEMLNMALTIRSGALGREAQDLVVSVRRCHSHLSRRA